MMKIPREFTINTAGIVTLSGSQYYISTVIETTANGTQIGGNLLAGSGEEGESVTLYDVESPAYVYIEFTIVGGGYVPAMYTRITF